MLPLTVNKIPRFAILFAAYNGVNFIPEQIDSILSQHGVDVKIFISIDKSTDGTESYFLKRSVSDSRLIILPFGERFGGAAPNFYRLLRDVDFSDFEYVSFADQDDIWNSMKLWRAHCLMTEQCSLGYSSNVTAFWPSGKTQLVNKAQGQRSLDFMFEAAGPGCTYVLRIFLALSLQNMVRGADDTLMRVGYHDWLIYAFARRNNYSWVIDDWSSMQYRQHANNQIGVNSGWRSYWIRVCKMISGHGFEQSFLIANLINAASTPVFKKGLKGGRLGYLWLAVHASQCRRRRLDQFWFFALCLLFAIAKPSDQSSA